MNKLLLLWDGLRSSLWFLPALLVAALALLGVGLVEVDVMERGELAERWPRLFGASAEGSRQLLAAIATSMITVVGVTFSVTTVALALASSQYTSRVLRNFMRDRANQTVLGVFAGVFAYSLVVLRTIRGGDERGFVPELAVLGAVILAFVAIGFLIFFIHHIAASIQATSIIRAVALETFEAADRLFPSELGEPATRSAAFDDQEQATRTQAWVEVPVRATGYIQAIDTDALVKLAREHKVLVRMERAVGEFIIEACPLVSIAGGSPDDGLIAKLNAAYTIGRDRTVNQDVGYGIRQLVDIALKALSPGINDSTTAVNCLDFLGAILARVAARQIETRYRSDDDGPLRVIARGPTFTLLLGEALDQIRQNAQGNVAVLVRLLQVIEIVASRTTDPERRSALAQQAAWTLLVAERSVSMEHERAQIRAACTLCA